MIKNLTLFLVVFVFSLEIGLRVTRLYSTFSEASSGNFWFEWENERDTAHYSHKANSTFISSIGSEGEWEYQTNQFGYRERLIPEKRLSKKTVFTFGDSFTEGLGANFDDSWPRQLERLVQQDDSLSLFNCGMSGSDPFYEYWSLKNALINYSPTHVIFSINDSDFDDFLVRGGYSRFRPDGSVKYQDAPWFFTIYRFSHIVRMLVHEIYDYNYFLIRRNNLEAQRAEVADSIAQCLRDVNALCLANNIKFMAVIHPVPHLVCFESEQSKSEVLALNSHKFDFPVIRMYEPLKAAMTGANCTSYHWKIDSHFNGKGYQLFGSLLYDKIEEEYPRFWDSLKSSVPSGPLLREEMTNP